MEPQWWQGTWYHPEYLSLEIPLQRKVFNDMITNEETGVPLYMYGGFGGPKAQKRAGIYRTNDGDVRCYDKGKVPLEC